MLVTVACCDTRIFSRPLIIKYPPDSYGDSPFMDNWSIDNPDKTHLFE